VTLPHLANKLCSGVPSLSKGLREVGEGDQRWSVSIPRSHLRKVGQHVYAQLNT